MRRFSTCTFPAKERTGSDVDLRSWTISATTLHTIFYGRSWQDHALLRLEPTFLPARIHQVHGVLPAIQPVQHPTVLGANCTVLYRSGSGAADCPYDGEGQNLHLFKLPSTGFIAAWVKFCISFCSEKLVLRWQKLCGCLRR